MMLVKTGKRGEVVIPKKLREYMGLSQEGTLKMELQGGKLIIEVGSSDDPTHFFERSAQEINADRSKLKLGDELYEEVF